MRRKSNASAKAIGHKVKGETQVFLTGARRGATRTIKREMLRRAAVEPLIGHMKNDGRLDRNYLLGRDGDKINPVLCGLGQNIRLLLRWFSASVCLFLAMVKLSIWPSRSNHAIV